MNVKMSFQEIEKLFYEFVKRESLDEFSAEVFLGKDGTINVDLEGSLDNTDSPINFSWLSKLKEEFKCQDLKLFPTSDMYDRPCLRITFVSG